MRKSKKKIYLYLYFFLCIVAGSFAVIFLNFRKQAKLQQEILHLEKNLIIADSLTQNMLQIESDKRGFQLTADVSFLRNFYLLKMNSIAAVKDLQARVRQKRDKDIVQKIQSLIGLRMSNLDSGVIVFTTQGPDAATAFMQVKAKREVREELNRQIAQLKDSFLQQLATNTHAITAKDKRNLSGLIVLFLIFVAVMLIATRIFRRSQQKIIQSHRKFKEAQRIGKIGSWEWDITTNKLLWSAEQYRLFGEDRKEFELTMDSWLAHLPETERANTRELIDEALNGKRGYSVEHEIIRGDGSKLMVYEQATVLYDDEQRPVGMFGTTQDISERKKVEKELLQAKKKLQTIFDNSPDGIYQSTLEGRFLMINPAMARMFGYRSVGEFISYFNDIGTQLYANPADRQRMLEILVQNDVVENFEVELLTRNGQSIWVSESGRAVRNDKGAILYFEGTIRDITEKRKHNEELTIARNRFQAIFDHSAEGIYQSTADGRFLIANPSMARIFGYDSPDDLINNVTDIAKQLYADPVERNKMSELLLKQDQIENYEIQVLTKTKEVIWVSANIRIVRNDHGDINFYEGTLEDITDRKKAEQEILQLNRSLDQFANITAHDLQEPIRMVSGFLGLLDKKYNDVLDDTGRSYIFRAKDGADRMSILIRDLLEFSRSGNKAAKKQFVDMTYVMDLVDKDLSIVMADTGTTLRLPPAMPVVFGTQSALYRLLLNLVSNGIKFRKKDVPPVVTITATEMNDHWLFSVQDNGIGVAEEDQPKLFQAFQRLHRREEYPGTGLGLVTCKKIVESHGGKIWMTSEAGVGTSFHFTLSKSEEVILAA